ncbi:hypothetical protein BO78DRAFT_375624, partial [Aspergillus sclerotiicarbonarius CBS 121057]
MLVVVGWLVDLTGGEGRWVGWRDVCFALASPGKFGTGFRDVVFNFSIARLNCIDDTLLCLTKGGGEDA